MFPNFKSLADKERKRRALLRQIALDSEIDQIKRDAYEPADWTSDQEKALTLAKSVGTATSSTQTGGVSVSTIATQASPSTSTSSIQVSPSVMNTSVQATVPAITNSAQTDDIGDKNDSVSDLDDTSLMMTTKMKRQAKKLNLPEDQKLPRLMITEMFSRYPELAMERISPLKTSGFPDELVFIGKEGNLYSKRSSKRSKKREDIYDWRSTLPYIKAILDTQLQTPVPVLTKPSTESGSDIEMDAFDTSKSILNNNDLPIRPVPYKKGTDRAGNPIPINNSFQINRDMKIIDRNGQVLQQRNDISWTKTLDKFVNVLTQQNVPFKESKLFKTVRPYVPSSNGREINIDMAEIGTQVSDREYRSDVVQLFKDNTQLVNARIHPISKREKDGKTRFASGNYVLSYFSKIIKANGEDLDAKQSERLDKNTDWRETLAMIIDQNPDLQFIKRVPRSRRSSSLHLLDLGEPDASRMSGVGIAGLRGRRSILKHEFNKLHGEAGLSNDSRRVSRELRLL